MRKIIRGDAPDWLKENWEKWGRKLKENRAKKNKFLFQWATYQGIKVNQILKPLLQEMTQAHCSYCDGYPFSMSKETIDHFRPKSKYPELAYQWENLFLCCDRCQYIKGEKFNKRMLKTDEISYNFSDYFIINYKEGTILPNPIASLTNRQRAAITIDLLQLNDKTLCHTRIRELRNYRKRTQGIDINHYNSRFFLE